MKGKSWFLGLLMGVACVLVGAQLSFGAGFALYEGSARGNALGGTLVGRADDPSAIFFNPAGITQLPGFQVMAGATFISPSADVEITGGGTKTTTQTEDNIWVPPHFYATYQFNDNIWFGLGTFSRFGLGTEFDEDWVGRYNNYNAVIQTLSINPNIALKLNDRLSVAAGFEVMWFDVEIERKIAPQAELGLPSHPMFDVDRSLSGDSFGYGFNLGLRYQPLDWLAFGISYRSQVKQSVDGEADFTRPGTYPLLVAMAGPVFGPLANNSFLDTDASATITLPDMLFTGIMFKPMDRLSVEIGATYTGWSSYQELAVRYESSPLGGGGPATLSDKKDWNDVWRLQVGVEYKALDWLDLRVGYVFDESPINDAYADYLVPANDRHLYSVGTGFHWDAWTLDLSYTYLDIVDRDVNARGRWPATGSLLESDFEDGNAHLFGVSVGYKF